MSATSSGELRVGRIALTTAPFAGVVLATIVTGVVGPVLLHALVGAGVVAVCVGLGVPVLRWLALPDLTPVERVVMSATAGAGVVGILLFALGFAGWLYPPIVLTCGGAAVGLAAWATRPWQRARAVAVELERMVDGPVGLSLLGAATLAFGMVLSASVVPPWDWDSMMYHLTLPGQFLERGTVLFEPVNVHLGYVGTAHLLYVLAAAVGVPQAATAVSGLFGLLLGLIVYRVALRDMGGTAAGLAVAGLAGSTIIALVAITPRVDVSLALFLFLTHFVVLRAARGASPRFVIAAGIFGGVALATKLHAGAYLLPLAAWVLWLVVRRQAPARVAVLALGAGSLLAAPWLVRGWALFGDPLFPLITGTGIPPWLRADERVAAVASSVTGGVLGRVRDPVTLGALLFEPGLLSPETEARYYVWSPLLLVGFLFVLVSRSAWYWAVPAVAYALIVLGRSLRTNLRYLIPVIPAISLAAAGALDRALRRWPRVHRWLMGILFVTSLAPLALPVTLVWSWIRSPVESGRYDTIYAIAATASQIVPEDGTILMLYEARGLPFERHVIQDNRILTWPLLHASGHAGECLRELPVTHVLINTAALGFYQQRAGSIQHVSDGSLDRFVQRCLVMEAERGGHVLFRIRPAAGTARDSR